MDNGYSAALMHHIISLLKLQPNSMNEDRNRLLIMFGRLIRDTSISTQDCNALVQNCLFMIPTRLVNTKHKELLETGHMWARIAQSKLGLVPQTLTTELLRSLQSISLPNLMASKNNIVTCTSLVDIAFRFVIGLETTRRWEKESKALRASILRIHEMLYSNINVIRKVQPISDLERKIITALSSIWFEHFFPTLQRILEDSTGLYATVLKKEALKCLFRRMIQHPNDDTLRTVLHDASRNFLSTAPHSPLHGLCSQIVAYICLGDVNLCLPIPLVTEVKGAGTSLSELSSSLFSIASLKDGFHVSALSTLRLFCSGDEMVVGDEISTQDVGGGLDGSGPDSALLLSEFFDSMTNFENVLETLNRYPMTVLTQVEKLADFPDQQDGAFLSSLQETLLHQLEHPEEGTHTGLLQWVSGFHARPAAQKELVLCVLRSPTLLSNPLFLYHLSRVSLGFQVASSSSAMLYTPQYARSIPAGDVPRQPSQLSQLSALTEGTMDVHVIEQENLKKRKEMALRMIDDLDVEEGTSPKRVSRDIDTSHLSNSHVSSKTSTASHDIGGESNKALKRTTRSQTKSAMPAASSSSASVSAKTSSVANMTSKKSEKRPGSDGGSARDAVEVVETDSSSPSVLPSSGTSPLEKKKSKATGSGKKASIHREKVKSSRKKEVCNLWIQHRCYKGDDCPYLHEGTQMTFDTICKFHRTGNCNKGAMCPFSHDLKSEACNNLVSNGTCKFGDRCAYSHDSAKIQTAKSQAEAKRKQEEEEKEKAAKDAQLPFAQHIVPILFQPDFMRPTDEGIVSGNTSIGVQEEARHTSQESNHSSTTPTLENPKPMADISHAYVPPTLASLTVQLDSIAQSKRTSQLITIPAVPVPLIPPSLVTLKPPRPLTNDSSRDPQHEPH